MDHVRIRTAHNVGIDVEIAGLGDRVIAALIDYGILLCYLVSATVVIGLSDSTTVLVTLYVPFLVYFPAAEILFDGQSIGKKIRAIKVARLDGSPPTLGNYLLRWLLRPVDLDLSLGMVGIVTVLVNGRGQRLGDLAAGTTVVKVTPRVRLSDTIFAPVAEDYAARFPQADRLDEDDVETAREVLRTLVTERRSPATQQVGARLKAVLESKMGLRSDLAPHEFLRTVIDDYNALKGSAGRR